MTRLQALEAARALFEDAAKWRKGEWGFEFWPADITGPELVLHDDDCYCAVGGLAKVTGLDPDSVELWALAQPLADALSEEWVGEMDEVAVAQVTVFNDREETTVEDVRALYDRAIALERKRPAA